MIIRGEIKMTLGNDNTAARRDRPSNKKTQAQERFDAYSELTAKQKIQKLDDKLGKGVGAKKQRAILAEQLEKEKFNNTISNHPLTDQVIKQYQKPADAPLTPPPAVIEGAQNVENTIMVFKSSENDGFVAKIKGIKEPAYGATKAEARANAKRLINAQK